MPTAYLAALLIAQCAGGSCQVPVQTVTTTTTQTTYAPAVYAQPPVVYTQPMFVKKKFFKRRGCCN